MSSFAEVARKADRLSRELGPQGRKKMLVSLAKQAKADYASEIERVTGPDFELRNWRRPPKKRIHFRARYKLFGDDTQAGITPAPVGPYKVLDLGRRPGVSKKGRPYSGTRGNGISPAARNKIVTRTPKRAEAETAKAIARGWRI